MIIQDYDLHYSTMLPIFVIWPNYGTYAISCNYVTASFLARTRALANSSALRGAHQLQFSHATASNLRHFVQLRYLCDSLDLESANLLTHVHTCVIFPALPGN